MDRLYPILQAARSKAPPGPLQPLGEIPLQACCRFDDEESLINLEFYQAAATATAYPCLSEQPSSPGLAHGLPLPLPTVDP